MSSRLKLFDWFVASDSNSNQPGVRIGRVIAVVLFGVLGAVLISLYWHRSQFAKDVRKSVAAASDGMELCDLRGDEAHDCALVGSSPSDSALIAALSNANASLEPGKVPIVSERILRIRGRGMPAGQYASCYRLVELKGFTEIYITEVEMDRGCVRIERYLTGSAAISPLG